MALYLVKHMDSFTFTFSNKLIFTVQVDEERT